MCCKDLNVSGVQSDSCGLGSVSRSQELGGLGFRV